MAKQMNGSAVELSDKCGSCSPFRVPVARLAAAQAAIGEKRKAAAKKK